MIKIARANPYNAEDEQYFERRVRVGRKKTRKFVGRGLLAYLYCRTLGKGAHCHQSITEAADRDRHHVKPGHPGGPDTDDNTMLPHPYYYDPVHHEGLHIANPRHRCRAAHMETGPAGECLSCMP
jgi:hypothetical protein